MKTKIIALMAAGLLTMSLVAPAFAAAEKVLVCHNESNGSYHVIEVSMNSWLNSHSNHKEGSEDFLITNADATIEAQLLADCLDLS